MTMLRRGRRRLLLFPLLGATLVAASLAAGASAAHARTHATYTIRYALGGGQTSSVGVAARVFKKRVEAATNGEVSVDIYYTGELGSNQSITDQAYSGNIQMVTIDPNFFVKYYSSAQLTDLPYIFSDSQNAFDYWDGPVGNEEKAAILSHTGLRVLNAEEFGFHDLANSVRPIHTVADVKGLKLQSTGSTVYRAFLSALGAQPVVLQLNEAYTAIQQGVSQGIDLGFNSLVATKIYEVAKYITVSHDTYSTALTLVYDKWWRTLPNADQKAIYNALQVAQAVERKGSVAADKVDQKYVEAHGATVTELTPAQRAGFVNAVKPLYDNLATTPGPDAAKWYAQWTALQKNTRVSFKKGDTLRSLAKKYLGSASNWKQIAKLNEISSTSKLTPGQAVWIPKK